MFVARMTIYTCRVYFIQKFNARNFPTFQRNPYQSKEQTNNTLVRQV